MSTRALVEPNQPVGVIAAQSLGEPGTQLTLDTKHGSGVAGSGAIARGLPRGRASEARAPKGQAFVAPVAGVVETWEDGNKYVIQITPEAGETIRIPLEGRKPTIKDGASIQTGDVLSRQG